MLGKNQVQPAPDSQLEIRMLKQENQRLRDTVALLKEQLRKEHLEREMYSSLLSKAEIEIQMLKKALGELDQGKKDGAVTSRAPPRPPGTSKHTIQDVSLDQSSFIRNPSAKNILVKKNSNLSNLAVQLKEPEHEKESGNGLKTLKHYRGGSSSTSNLHKTEQADGKSSQFGTLYRDESAGRLSQRRRTYFDKIAGS